MGRLEASTTLPDKKQQAKTVSVVVPAIEYEATLKPI
jgi:hypothetical protein